MTEQQKHGEKPVRRILRCQTVYWIGAQFGVCRSLELIDKPLNTVHNVSGFHLQNFRGVRSHIFVIVSRFR